MSMPTHPHYALVRGLSNSFAHALSMEAPEEAIDVERAKAQHAHYTRCLAEHVAELLELPAEEQYPDCCFIEDTVIVVGSTAILTRIGAPTRLGETASVAAALRRLQEREPRLSLRELSPPALLDGGDVLQMGEKVFVGLSQRTNQAALEQLEALLPGRVRAVPVAKGLHLKSLLSAVDDETLLLAEDLAARAMGDAILEALPPHARCVVVPDQKAANVLRVGNHLFMQEGFPQSEVLLKALAEEKGLALHTLCMSELMKADGALTCCSVLFGPL